MIPWSQKLKCLNEKVILLLLSAATMVVFPWAFLQESLLQVSFLMPCLLGPLQRPHSPQATASQQHTEWGHWPLAPSTYVKVLYWATCVGMASICSDEHLNLNPFLPNPSPFTFPFKDSDLDCHPKQLILLPYLFIFCKALPPWISCTPNSILASTSQRTWIDT